MTMDESSRDMKMEVDTNEVPGVEIKPTQHQLVEQHNSQPINIVRRFSSGWDSASQDFNGLVGLLRQVRRWTEEQRTEFLVQFMGSPGLFNSRCTDFIYELCNMRWTIIPLSIRAEYVKFLISIGMVNPYDMSTILKSMIDNCLEIYQPTVPEESIQHPVSNEEREDIFKMGLEGIFTLVSKNSGRFEVLIKLIVKRKQHKSKPKENFYSYFRLLIVLSEAYPANAYEFWLLIIDCMLSFDSEVSKGSMWQSPDDIRRIFPKYENNYIGVIDDENAIFMQEKLDSCMLMVLCYISLGTQDPPIKPTEFEYTKWMDGLTPRNDLFLNLSTALESLVLCVYEVENVPFIWLYLCAVHPPALKKLLNQLWKIINTPFKTPNDWKKVHNAVTFMASLLARGKFVDLDVAKFWLKKMVDWCVAYVNNARHVKFGGGIQHSTFYATVQAAFFLLCFRYKEFNEAKIADEIRLWGISRIVHSQLEPLNFIPKPLAIFFASISRYMQIVYCNHIVNMSADYDAVEANIQFLHYGIEESGKRFQPYLRIFEPMENDLDTLNTIRSRKTTEITDGDNEYDFMVDDGIELDDYDLSIATE